MHSTWLPAIFLLLITASGLTINWWRNPSRSAVKSYADQKSLILFRVLYPAGILVAFLLSYLTQMSLHLSITAYYALSISFFLLGMMIRWIAVLSLKRAFTVKIAIVKNHELKTNGIYRYMRHPSYTGLILYYIGLGIALNNLLSLLLLTGITSWVIRKRIKLEEEVLIDHFGEKYLDYQRHTKALIPGVL